MPKITSFKELLVWEKSHELTLLIYKLVSAFPKFEEFGLASQMRRSSSSVPSNIAEGFKRHSANDSRHFYNIAAASLEELKYQLILSRDLGYITGPQYSKSDALAEEISKMLYSWAKSQKSA